uniref:Uncharacterized protein n=1 Tax=Arundo donax TaxID=35708 RepID=A0A0A9CRK3_ARUDO
MALLTLHAAHPLLSPDLLLSIKSSWPPCPGASPLLPRLHCYLPTPSAADPLHPHPFPCCLAPSSLPLFCPSTFMGPSAAASSDRPAPCRHLFGVPCPASLLPTTCFGRMDLELLDFLVGKHFLTVRLYNRSAEFFPGAVLGSGRDRSSPVLAFRRWVPFLAFRSCSLLLFWVLDALLPWFFVLHFVSFLGLPAIGCVLLLDPRSETDFPLFSRLLLLSLLC